VLIGLIILVGALYRPGSQPPSQRSQEDNILVDEHFHCQMFGVPSNEYEMAASAFGGTNCSEIDAEYERRGLGH
jgi:hypothetical protein